MNVSDTHTESNLELMSFTRRVIALVLMVSLGLLLPGCETPPPTVAPVVRKPAPDLLAALYFYHSHQIGGKSRPTGLQHSGDGGTAWQPLTWPELISSSVAVDGSGRWIYLACGNGVLVSRDGGQSWTLTGGWEMAEVQRVCIDSRDPRGAWAASAYGLHHCPDLTAGGHWRLADARGEFRFVNDVVQDRSSPERLWLGTESGIFLSRDEGRSFRSVQPGLRIRRITQDRLARDRLWATSDGGGLLRSEDRGLTWSALSGSPEVCFCLEQHPTDPAFLLCGTRQGVACSRDGGLSWRTFRAGLPENYLVFDLLVATDGRWLAAGSNGVLVSDDEGRRWSPLAFEGALVSDLAQVALAEVPGEAPSAAAGTLDLSGPDPVLAEHRPPSDPAFEARRETAYRELVAKLPEDPAKHSFFSALLAVREDRAGPEVWQRLRELLETPRHSMFYSLPLVGFALHCREALPADVAVRIREVLTGSTVYRGDTENHWVMHYAALLLTAQTYPETPARDWYMGCSSREIYADAKGWLKHWARLTAERGQGEFDSPHYIYMYLLPMLLLYDFAEEAEVRQLAGMMLDLILADYLSESLAGAYCGGHSRDLHPEQVRNGSCAGMHYLYAGGIERPRSLHGWLIAAVTSRYRPPREFPTMANQRDEAVVRTEVKRVRNAIRFSRDLNPPVYKYDYMTPNYCLGSLQGGILQPIQQHTWDVSWKGSFDNSIFFALHPFVSGRELGMFFPEEVHYLVEGVTAQKGIYASPDKLYSSSPYEKVFQHENVLLALYQVPEQETFPHLNLYFPRGLEREEHDGWIFGRDGDFYLACRLTREGGWLDFEEHELLRCSGAATGIVVVTPPVTGAATTRYADFKDQILASRLSLEGEGATLTLTFEMEGQRYSRCWSEASGRLNRVIRDFPHQQLFSGPFLQSRVHSRIIEITDGTTRRILNFNDFSIRVAGEVRFMILDPGHFHAALVQKTMYDRVSPVVHVYAPEGPAATDHLQRVDGFNTRAEAPTTWEVKVYQGEDYLEKMLREKPGNVVVLSGDNGKKAGYIRACVEAGLHVLADKPMCIDAEGYASLQQALALAEEKGLLVNDIMTERFEITSILQKNLMNRPEVFGEIVKGTPDDPAVVKESVHHFFKQVAGQPIKRPAWYFDTARQGEGIVDVSTHLVDLVMGALCPGEALDFDRDVQMLSGRRWPTLLTEEQFREVTRLEGFPPEMKKALNPDGTYPCHANGELAFTLKGVHVKVGVVWNYQALEGARDSHYSLARGARARIEIRHGKEQHYRPELYVTAAPGADREALGAALEKTVSDWQKKFPGIALEEEGEGWHLLIPDAFRIGHEAHFRQVTEHYLRALDCGKLPAWEVPNLLTKYRITTEALKMALE